jgi:hypothetical protein
MPNIFIDFYFGILKIVESSECHAWILVWMAERCPRTCGSEKQPEDAPFNVANEPMHAKNCMAQL